VGLWPITMTAVTSSGASRSRSSAVSGPAPYSASEREGSRSNPPPAATLCQVPMVRCAAETMAKSGRKPWPASHPPASWESSWPRSASSRS